MFEALGFALEGDHLDLSFHDTTSWPRVGPAEGMPPSLFISLGDPVSGPDFQMVALPAQPEDLWLPIHYHGCDQFRAMLQGEFVVQRKRLTFPAFGYQASGIPYKEGVYANPPEDAWMIMVHGSRRGARSTVTRQDGTMTFDGIAEDQLDREVASPDDPYWTDIPGGAKGIVGLGTTFGRSGAPYVWNSFDESTGWLPMTDGVEATVGVMSDAETGPVVMTLRAAPDRIVLPPSNFDTEIVLTVIRGSCLVGEHRYIPGEVRIQRAGADLASIVSGPEGLHAVLVISDRRAQPRFTEDTPGARAWVNLSGAFVEELKSGNKPA